MSLISFIDKNTFEVKDELEEYIYCDYEIRNVIATLNKKGYKTRYSCAGHNEVGLLWPLHKEDIDNLNDYLKDAENDRALHYVKKEGNYFYHKDEKVATYTYISFADNYKFETQPDNFKYELIDGKSYLSKRIDFYKDDNHLIRKTDIEINEELNSTILKLEKWAKSLPLLVK